MSGDKTKAVAAASVLGVMVLGFGCYFVFAGGSEAQLPNDTDSVVSVASTPAPSPPDLGRNHRPMPERKVVPPRPRTPTQSHKAGGEGRVKHQPKTDPKKKKNPPSC